MIEMATVAGSKLPGTNAAGSQNVNNLWKAASGKGFNVKKYFSEYLEV